MKSTTETAVGKISELYLSYFYLIQEKQNESRGLSSQRMVLSDFTMFQWNISADFFGGAWGAGGEGARAFDTMSLTLNFLAIGRDWVGGGENLQLFLRVFRVRGWLNSPPSKTNVGGGQKSSCPSRLGSTHICIELWSSECCIWCRYYILKIMWIAT